MHSMSQPMNPWISNERILIQNILCILDFHGIAVGMFVWVRYKNEANPRIHAPQSGAPGSGKPRKIEFLGSEPI